ncbi:family 16 glycosylhydrolase [Mycoplasmatota bacterium WC30]
MKKIFIMFMALLIISLVSCGLQVTTELTTEVTAEVTTEVPTESTTSQTTQATTQATTESTTTQTTTQVATQTTTQETTQETTTLPVTTIETTTEFVYDDRSLVSETCAHLDNIGDYQPVWCDEFNYEGLPDSTLWSYDVGGSGWGNNELQYYTRDDLDNASVSDGTLKITAIKEAYSGNDYTSARLITKYKGEWLYGKIQVKAKLPSGTGTWPAIWMLPTDWKYGGWPASGEIDIMEHVGYDPDHVFGTLHTGERYGGNAIGYTKTLLDSETEFHVYEIEWEPGKIEVFIDGTSFGVFGFNPLYNIDVENTDAWPFDQRFHLLMNIAVGGDWGGAQGVDDTIFPQTMEIDYVRVYQKDYEGMDQEAPTVISELSMLKTTQDSIKVYWDKATDDIMVKEYEIYLDQVLNGTTSLNAFKIDDLLSNTMYRIDVVAVDFAGNRSDATTLNIQTETVRSSVGIIEAETYDSQYGVAKEVCEDEGGGFNVSYISTNDFMEYTLLVPEDGTYTITYRVASESTGGEIKLYGKSILPLATTALPVTGGWQTWTSVTSDTFNLTAGVYTFKIKASIGGFNLNYFEFKKVE